MPTINAEYGRSSRQSQFWKLRFFTKLNTIMSIANPTEDMIKSNISNGESIYTSWKNSEATNRKNKDPIVK